jgi:hypothetical protein
METREKERERGKGKKRGNIGKMEPRENERKGAR